MMTVLLLNTTYEPMHVVSLRRAVTLVLQEKAHLVESSERNVRSPSLTLPEPLVIRLRGRAPVARQRAAPLSRSAILARDGYTCQYCGLALAAGRLTIDHLLPQSRGGGWAWTNLVAACPACNTAKANRTPAEAGMALLRQPGKPIGAPATLLHNAQINPAWRQYLWTS
jgi:5-methylcytosine-specific restriction endonuclease McrA